MYSRARYGLARYSLGGENRVIEAGEDFSEALGGLAGGAVPVDVGESFGAALLGSAHGVIAIDAAFAARAGLLGAARLSADVDVGAGFFALLDGAAYAQKDIPAPLEALEGLLGTSWVGKDIPAPAALADRLDGRAAGSKDIPGDLSAWEVLTSMGEATSQTTRQAMFQLTIPPGGELRIDSGLFLVLLDGENALHAQSGDWVDVSRELLRLNIESASGGGLEGQMIYTERFL